MQGWGFVHSTRPNLNRTIDQTARSTPLAQIPARRVLYGPLGCWETGSPRLLSAYLYFPSRRDNRQHWPSIQLTVPCHLSLSDCGNSRTPLAHRNPLPRTPFPHPAGPSDRSRRGCLIGRQPVRCVTRQGAAGALCRTQLRLACIRASSLSTNRKACNG